MQHLLDRNLTRLPSQRATLLRKRGSIYLKITHGAYGKCNARIDLNGGTLRVRTTDEHFATEIMRQFRNARLLPSKHIEIPLRGTRALSEVLGKLELVALPDAFMRNYARVMNRQPSEWHNVLSVAQRRLRVPKIDGCEWEARLVLQLVGNERHVTAKWVKAGTNEGVNTSDLTWAAASPETVAAHIYADAMPNCKPGELMHKVREFDRELGRSAHSAADEIEKQVVTECEKLGYRDVRAASMALDFQAEMENGKLVPILTDLGVGSFGIVGLAGTNPEAAERVLELHDAEELRGIRYALKHRLESSMRPARRAPNRKPR